MEETSLDMALTPSKPVETHEVHHTKKHLKDLMEEAEMDETMKEVERPPSSSLLQVES
jgi:hypothetical protein